jgi:hypothetical protein
MKWLSGRSLELILLLAPLGLAGFFAGRNFWAEHHFSAAESAIQRRDFSVAEEHLHHCLAVWPRRPDLYLLLAQCARRSNGFDQAADYLADYERLGGVPAPRPWSACWPAPSKGTFPHRSKLPWWRASARGSRKPPSSSKP